MSTGRSNTIFIEIKKDENGHYTLEDVYPVTGKNIKYFDGKELIAEVNFSSKSVCHIAIKTNLPVNIAFNNVDLKDCIIQSSGPICFVSKLNVSNKLHLSASSAYFIESTVYAKNAVIDISGLMYIDELSVLALDHSSGRADKVEIRGGLVVEESHLEANNLTQRNYFSAKKSSVIVLNKFIAKEKSETEFDLCLAPSFDENTAAINIGEMCIDGGKLTISRSNYNGNSVYGFSSHLSVLDDSLLVLHKTLMVDDASTTKFQKTKLVIEDVILNADSMLSACDLVVAKSFRHLKKPITIVDTSVLCDDTLTLCESVMVRRSQLCSASMRLEGRLGVEKSRLTSKGPLKIETEREIDEIGFVSCTVQADHLYLYGYGTKNIFTIEDSKFVANLITQKGRVTLTKQSELIGCDETVQHQISGILKLKDSVFFTNASVVNTRTAKISVKKTVDQASSSPSIQLRADKGIANSGKIKVRSGNVLSAGSFSQVDGVLSVKEASQVIIDGDLQGYGETLELDDGSLLYAKNMFVNGDIKANISCRLEAGGYLYTSYTASIHGGSKLRLYAKKFISCGRAEFNEADISAKLFFIFNSFEAIQGQSRAEEVSIGTSGHMKTSFHETVTKQFDSQGIVTLHDSVVAALSTTLHDDSITEMEGETVLQSQEMAIFGSVKSTSTKKNKKTAIPRIATVFIFSRKRQHIWHRFSDTSRAHAA